jgi:hypothetical protein
MKYSSHDIAIMYRTKEVLMMSEAILLRLQPTEYGWVSEYCVDQYRIEYSNNEYIITIRDPDRNEGEMFSKRTELFTTKDFFKLVAFILHYTKDDGELRSVVMASRFPHTEGRDAARPDGTIKREAVNMDEMDVAQVLFNRAMPIPRRTFLK